MLSHRSTWGAIAIGSVTLWTTTASAEELGYRAREDTNGFGDTRLSVSAGLGTIGMYGAMVEVESFDGIIPGLYIDARGTYMHGLGATGDDPNGGSNMDGLFLEAQARVGIAFTGKTERVTEITIDQSTSPDGRTVSAHLIEARVPSRDGFAIFGSTRAQFGASTAVVLGGGIHYERTYSAKITIDGVGERSTHYAWQWSLEGLYGLGDRKGPGAMLGVHFRNGLLMMGTEFGFLYGEAGTSAQTGAAIRVNGELVGQLFFGMTTDWHMY
ncbi:MAG: hypothetical protein ACHREM_22465 [Polyangiales bacterium]